VVYAIPRGGVEVAAEIARAKGWLLDVVVPRKLGAPGNPELGVGAIAPGVRVLDAEIIERLGIGPGYLEGEVARQEEEIARRTRAYRGDRPQQEVQGRTAVVVDDGVATGGTAAAALRWVRARGAARVVLAVPVAPPEAVARLAEEADRVVCLETPEPFHAVGQWYRRFPQVSDQEVVRLLGDGG
jgi:putative phosphoribosyl transferase